MSSSFLFMSMIISSTFLFGPAAYKLLLMLHGIALESNCFCFCGVTVSITCGIKTIERINVKNIISVEHLASQTDGINKRSNEDLQIL